MHDRTTKALLLLIFLALVLNAFVMLMQPGRAADAGTGRYAIVSYGYGGLGPGNNWYDRHGYYRLDTVTGDVTRGGG